MVLENKETLKRWLLKESSLHSSYKKIDNLKSIIIDNSIKQRINLNLDEMKKLEIIHFQNCEKLTHLNIKSNYIKKLNIHSNFKLKQLKINCPNLQSLLIESNNIEKLIFKKDNAIDSLSIMSEPNLKELKLDLYSVKENLFLIELPNLKNPIINLKNKSSNSFLIDLDYNVIFYKKNQAFHLYKDMGFEPILEQKTSISKDLF